MKKLMTGLFVVALGFGLAACNKKEESQPATTEQAAPAAEQAAPAAPAAETPAPAPEAAPEAAPAEAPVDAAPAEETPAQ